MKLPRKLFWLECTNFSPLAWGLLYFKTVGFDAQCDSWTPGDVSRLMEWIFPKIETWLPDIIACWIHSDTLQEPTEWIEFCHRIREHPNLQHTRFMVFLPPHKDMVTPSQEALFDQRYDYYDYGLTLLGIPSEPAKIAKQLVEEDLKGFEGVNYYLHNNGKWKLHETPINSRLEVHPTAIGEFTKPPQTRLLTTDKSGKCYWEPQSIRAEVTTYITYIIKQMDVWQQGLSKPDISTLSALAQKFGSGKEQLLIGVNHDILALEKEKIIEIVEYAQQLGGWRLFINEHLWAENFPGIKFEIYENEI